MLPINLFKTAFNNDHYYHSMNEALKAIDGHYRMLHYPYHNQEGESFFQAQENMINYCVDQLSSVSNKRILDLGCGNGVVALHLAKNYPVNEVLGIDLNSNNVLIANREKEKQNASNVRFMEDDAQQLRHIPDNSIDVVINLESAFHYPDKNAFLKAVNRVLKPGGEFMIADIISTKPGNAFLKPWKKRMSFYHWSLSDYLAAFKQSNLDLVAKTDISERVIKGFRAYRDYLKGFQLRDTFKNKLLKWFFVINARIVIHTFNQKRRYYVFYGRKAA